MNALSIKYLPSLLALCQGKTYIKHSAVFITWHSNLDRLYRGSCRLYLFYLTLMKFEDPTYIYAGTIGPTAVQPGKNSNNNDSEWWPQFTSFFLPSQ